MIFQSKLKRHFKDFLNVFDYYLENGSTERSWAFAKIIALE